jgi:antitoxin HicB
LRAFLKKAQKTLSDGIGDQENGDRMKKTNRKKGRIGSSFDDFLKEDGTHDGVAERAIKRVLARQLDGLMRHEEISKTGTDAGTRTKRS